MVKVNYIIMSMEDYLQKCRTRGTNIPSIIREKQEQFRQKYADSKIEVLEVYTRDGETIFHNTGTSASVKANNDELKENHIHEVHQIHNHPEETGALPTCLSYNDMAHLLIRKDEPSSFPNNDEDYDTEFNIRSTTCVAENGSSMKLIRGNKFPHGEYLMYSTQDAENLFRTIPISYLGYKDSYINNYKNNMRWALKKIPSKEERLKLLHDPDFRTKISKQTIKEIGTLPEHFEKQGITKKLEQMDCKIEITLPDNVDYGEEIRSEYEIKTQLEDIYHLDMSED